MHPELFEVPVVHLIIRSYGVMMVIGFIAAVTIIRYLSRHFTSNPQHITNAALYFAHRRRWCPHVLRHSLLDEFGTTRWVSSRSERGLELGGGAGDCGSGSTSTITGCQCVTTRCVGDRLGGGLVFGRIGCFLNGCRYGKPTDLPWGVQFPYGSFSYLSQIKADPERNRSVPYIDLPDSYFGYRDAQGQYVPGLKPMSELTPEQRTLVTHGEYRGLAVHPTQLYSSAGAVLLGFILFLFLRRSQRGEESGSTHSWAGPARRSA
jgi:prolipoprotein diacylglyceryltransferase